MKRRDFLKSLGLAAGTAAAAAAGVAKTATAKEAEDATDVTFRSNDGSVTKFKMKGGEMLKFSPDGHMKRGVGIRKH